MDKSISEDIDLIRGIAALGVIVGHTLYEEMWTLNGAFWVWIFFVVSGYLQGYAFWGDRYALSPEGIRRFWINRGLRILPLFWLALLIALTLHAAAGRPLAFAPVVAQFFAMTSDYSLVGPLWTIACEIHFYILAPFVIWLLWRRGIAAWLVGWLMAFLLFYVGGKAWDNIFQPRTVLPNLMIFWGGMAVARFGSFSKGISSHWKYLLLSCPVLLALFFEQKHNMTFWKGTGMGLACMTGLMSISLKRSDELAVPGLRLALAFLKFVGRHCYGVYVYAALINVALIVCGVPHVGWKPFAAQLCAVAAAYISYRFFEKRFLALKGSGNKGTTSAKILGVT